MASPLAESWQQTWFSEQQRCVPSGQAALTSLPLQPPPLLPVPPDPPELPLDPDPPEPAPTTQLRPLPQSAQRSPWQLEPVWQ